MGAFLEALALGQQGDASLMAANEAGRRGLQELFTFLKNEEGAVGWLLVPIARFINSMAFLAFAADHWCRAHRQTPTEVDSLSSTLRAGFPQLRSRNHSEAKRATCLPIIVALLRIYFMEGDEYSFHADACYSIIKDFDPVLPDIERHCPGAMLAEYRFFQGRLALLGNSFSEAATQLAVALQQRQRCDGAEMVGALEEAEIYQQLALARMLTGQPVDTSACQRYGCASVIPLAAAVDQGDLALYTWALTTLGQHYRTINVFAVYRLQLLVYRGMIRRLLEAQGGGRLLQVEALQEELLQQGFDVGYQGAEWVVARLLDLRLLRGWYSPSNRRVVLDKDNTLPSVADSRIGLAV